MIQGALISAPVVSRHGIFFWLLRTIVKVRYTFFLTSVLLGMRTASVGRLLVWTLVSFLAILLHEFGHAFAARYYGQDPKIEIHGFGGVTEWAWVDELRWWQRVIISVAGPGIGFLVGGLLYLYQALSPRFESFWVSLASWYFLWATLAWGLFNLLPILPMDGGHVLDELLQHRMGQSEGRLRTRKISIGAAGLAMIAGIGMGEVWAVILCAIFAFDNYQRMRGLPGVELR
ncbi:MAG TPA: site-2 protease family protein [Vicinamibacteria bacterium]|nr:site-2 protease family protein [Vicinamibacteria bacterium]